MLKYENHSKFNNQHNRGEREREITRRRVVILVMNKTFIRDPKITNEVATTSFRICLPSCVFQYPMRNELHYSVSLVWVIVRSYVLL